MGIDFYPALMYGFEGRGAMLPEETILFDCMEPELRSGGEHVVGFSVKLKDLLSGEDQENNLEFARIMKEELGIECTYHLCLTGDTHMHGYSYAPVSTITLFKELNKKLSDEKILEIVNKIYKAKYGKDNGITMEELEEEKKRIEEDEDY